MYYAAVSLCYEGSLNRFSNSFFDSRDKNEALPTEQRLQLKPQRCKYSWDVSTKYSYERTDGSYCSLRSQSLSLPIAPNRNFKIRNENGLKLAPSVGSLSWTYHFIPRQLRIPPWRFSNSWPGLLRLCTFIFVTLSKNWWQRMMPKSKLGSSRGFASYYS